MTLLYVERRGKLVKEKTKLREMEELDARIEKINYDLIQLENRKKAIEDEKVNRQQEIDKLEKEKSQILAKTDNMKPLQKFIYVVLSLRNDLKKIDLMNAKILEHQKEKDKIQNKIDIQNSLYAETINEKEKCIEKRRKLYIDRTEEKNQSQENEKVSQVKALTQIYEIASQFKNNRVMSELSRLAEKEINQYINTNNDKTQNINQSEEQDEME